MPSADVAVGLTQAELQLEHAQLEQALATLRHLRTIAPRHTHVLKLLKILYERLGDWNELNALLPELKKRQVVAPAELKELEIRVCRMLLQSAAKSNDGDSLRTTWKSFPPQIRENEAMVMFYANHLKASAAEDEVVQLLRRALDHDWSDALAELYGSAEASDIAAQLTQAEKWLIDRPNNPTLLLALGRLCLKTGYGERHAAIWRRVSQFSPALRLIANWVCCWRVWVKRSRR